MKFASQWSVIISGLIGLVLGKAALASVDRCSSRTLETAAIGTTCETDKAIWEVRSDHGMRVYFDQASKIAVTGNLGMRKSFDEAQGSCPEGYHPPTVGIKDGGVAARDPQTMTGEFAALSSDGFLGVIPGLGNIWFWTSSLRRPGETYLFNGYDGSVYVDNSNWTYRYGYALICVSQPR